MVFTKTYVADTVILTAVMETEDATGDAKQQNSPTTQGIDPVIIHHILVHNTSYITTLVLLVFSHVYHLYFDFIAFSYHAINSTIEKCN